MNENQTATAWTASRGDKWSSQLAGMEAMLAPVNDPLIQTLQLDAPCRIADIGCGGGGTTIEVFRRAPAGSVVHGFDISPASIAAARAQVGSDQHDIAFEIADMSTAAPEQAYERLVSRFGIMFFDDPPSAFANLVHWLAPGGRFSFAVWDRPAANPWMTCVRQVVGEIISLPPSDPEAPGPFRYGDSRKLLKLLEQAGFVDLGVSGWRGALPIGGGLPAREAAEFALASFSSFAELLSKAGDEAFEQARQSLTERFSQHQQDGAVRMDASVHIFTGRRA